ncbi:MAG: hypothetical protein CVT92_16905 [Bacteroidetes bacterium HGW-Bacteroidetes-1]|jgi:RHS repeat-associated protein|nr:MAG: hypothetical protein CVT92_16905 [Bacteroidetes bacterium HGW-Bacteroidetes-1]
MSNDSAFDIALTSATTSPGIFPPAQQVIVYNVFDKVTSITEGDKSLQITYGHHRQRIAQQYTNGSNTTHKRWAGACEYITENGQQRILTYLSGPEGVFALHIKNPNGSENIRYTHKDHLGSWNTITNESGNLLQELSFDAWGNRRNPTTWRTYTTTPPTPLFDRGFTGHEHLYGFGLINMNGRIYDPVVSRMLSPDNFIQAPDFSQSFNRYSYAWNNPLVYTDPDGELFIIPYLSFSASGGLDFGVTVGIGIPGVLSAQATVGHSTGNNNTYFTVGGTAGGITGSFGWGAQSGYTASAGFGFGFPIPGVGTNMTSAGFSWSQHGGMSVGAFGFTMDSQGIGFNPSLGYSYGFTMKKGPNYQQAMYACKGCPTFDLPEVVVVGSRWTFNHGPVSDNTYIAPYQVNYSRRSDKRTGNPTSYYEWADRANTMYNLYNPNNISRIFSIMNTGTKLVEQYNEGDYLSMALTVGEVALNRNGYVTAAKSIIDLANSPSTQREVSGLLQRDAQYHYQKYQKTGSTWHYNQYMRYRSAVETARRKF